MRCKRINCDHATYTAESVSLAFSDSEIRSLKAAHKIIESARERLEQHISPDNLEHDYDDFHRADHSLESIISSAKSGDLVFSLD